MGLRAVALFHSEAKRADTTAKKAHNEMLISRISVLFHFESGFGFRVSGFGFRASGPRFRVSGSGFRVPGFGFRVSGPRFRVSGFGLSKTREQAWKATEIRRVGERGCASRLRVEKEQGESRISGWE